VELVGYKGRSRWIQMEEKMDAKGGADGYKK